MLVCCFGHPYSTLTPTLIFSVPQNWRRRLPAGWEEAMLPHLLSWLVGQCGAPQTEPACLFPLLEELTPLVPAAGGGAKVLERAPSAVHRNLSAPLSAAGWPTPCWRCRTATAGRCGSARYRSAVQGPEPPALPTVSGVTRMGDFFLVHRCCECWPLSGSD